MHIEEFGVLFCASLLLLHIDGTRETTSFKRLQRIVPTNERSEDSSGAYSSEKNGRHQFVTTQHNLRSTEPQNVQDNTSSAVYIVNYTQSTLETDYMALGGHRLTVVGRDIYKYGMTVLFVLGSIGNVLILLIVFKTPLRQSNVSLYLVVLAIFDQLTILIAVFGSHVLRSYTGFDYIRYNRWLCKSAYFTIFTCAQSSFFFVVAMSAERALAVFRPLQFKKFYTTKRTKIIIAGIVVFFCMKNLHMFWSSGALYRDVKVGNATTKVVISECDLVDEPLLKFNLKVRPWIDCGITFLACFIIVLSDAIIIATMTRTTILNKKTTTAPNTDTS